MKLSNNDLQNLCNLAIEAAKEAGKYIKKRANSDLKVHKKEGGEFLASQVVTEVDLESQEIIINHLKPSMAQFDFALLAEEGKDDKQRLEKDYFWCIDPLDGTLPFIERTPGYAVSIALIRKDGTPVIGVIYAPREGNLYHAIHNQGAFMNHKPWSIKETNFDRPLFFITDRSFLRHPRFLEMKENLLSISSDLGLNGLEIINFGGGAMNALWCIEHAPATYFKLTKETKGGGSIWDFAGTACILTELGASVSDIKGNTLDLNNSKTTFMNYCGVLFASDKTIADKIVSMVDEFQKISEITLQEKAS